MAYLELGFPHHPGRYRPEGSPFSSPVRWSRRFMEGFMIRGWIPTFPRCRWLHEPQPNSDQPVGLGFPHHAERYRLGGPSISSPDCWGYTLHNVWKDFDSGTGPYPPRLYKPQLGVSTQFREVSTRGTTVSIPGLFELCMCGRITDPGIELYPLWVALALRIPAHQQSASGDGVSTPCWDFHTVRSGINPGDHRFRPRFVGVVKVWKDFAT